MTGWLLVHSTGKHRHRAARASHLSGWEVKIGHLITIVTAILSVVLSPCEPRRSVKSPAGMENCCPSDKLTATEGLAVTFILSDDRPPVGVSVLMCSPMCKARKCNVNLN